MVQSMRIHKKKLLPHESSHGRTTCSVDKGKMMGVVSLDFSKAFDHCPGGIHLHKPSCGCQMNRYKNWLNSRAQRAEMAALGLNFGGSSAQYFY